MNSPICVHVVFHLIYLRNEEYKTQMDPCRADSADLKLLLTLVPFVGLELCCNSASNNIQVTRYLAAQAVAVEAL